jgi:hypothetical protein
MVTTAAAQQPAPPVTERREHVVREGDTLWDLARLYLGNPFLWPMIYEANRQIVQNPHRIFPTERLIIPPLPGETPVPAATPAPVQPAPVAPPPGPRTEIETVPPSSPRSRFYNQAAPQQDTATGPTMISAERAVLRRVQPKEYYSAPWLGDSTQLTVLGSVYMSYDPRIERDKLAHYFHPFDRLYLSYAGRTRPRVGDLLLVVSIGRKVGLGYGSIIEPTGVVRVDSLNQSTMVAMVTHQFGALRTGDLVIPMDSFPDLIGEPVEADGPAGGLIDFQSQEPLYGTVDRAFVSIGRNMGVKPGDEMVALLPQRRPERERDERLPARPIARLLVVRTTDRTSTVRVLSISEAALQPGMIVRVVRRMP